MQVHLIDGTYELFRHFYGLRRSTEPVRSPFDAVSGVVGSMLGLLEGGATHIAVATDHVIESFRNQLWPGYKTAEGIDPALLAQFWPLEDTLRAMGIVVWPMVEFEADDALAAGALRAAADEQVEQVLICSPDKDLCQCVSGDRIVQVDRRRRAVRNEAGVVEKFGVMPASIPDWLALVGDTADGFPGIPGWGEKTAALVLARYHHLDLIPAHLPIRGDTKLWESLETHRAEAILFRTLATLRTDVPVFDRVDELRWAGPGPEFEAVARNLNALTLVERAARLAATRAASTGQPGGGLGTSVESPDL